VTADHEALRFARGLRDAGPISWRYRVANSEGFAGMGAFAMQIFYPSFPYRRKFRGFLEAANAGVGS
jgi:hypothetical protein